MLKEEVALSPGLDPLSRYEALLRVSRAIAHHRSIKELLHAISGQLHLVVPFDHLMLVLHDPPTDKMHLVVIEPSDTAFAPFTPIPLNDWGPARSVWETQLTAVVPLTDRSAPRDGARVHSRAWRTGHQLAPSDHRAPARRGPRPRQRERGQLSHRRRGVHGTGRGARGPRRGQRHQLRRCAALPGGTARRARPPAPVARSQQSSRVAVALPRAARGLVELAGPGGKAPLRQSRSFRSGLWANFGFRR